MKSLFNFKYLAFCLLLLGPKTYGQFTSAPTMTSTLSANCGGEVMDEKAADYKECGECESALQTGLNSIIDTALQGTYAPPTGGHWSEAKVSGANGLNIVPGATVEKTLESITSLMRKQNGGNLNYVVLGNSHSVQGTRPGYPRIMLKSPNSEMMVTYNTDPMDPNYNTIEIQRWNGKLGKYVYQELDFGQEAKPQRGDHPPIAARPPHADLEGASCVACHKSPSPRPNWGTYRAWAEVIPPRDDMIENNPRSTSEYGTGSGAAVDPFGEAYFSFLGDVATAKSSSAVTGRPSRLSLLDVPYDATQLGAAPTSDRDKISRIRSRLNTDGFYRVPHFPQKATLLKSGNVDTKSAGLAGSSHLAFDQMSGQNMCRVATDLKKDPNFDKFKYALTAIAQCGVNDFATLQKYLPPWALTQAQTYFSDPAHRTAHPVGTTTPISGTGTNNDIFDTVVANTRNSQSKADEYKRQQSVDFLVNDLYRQRCNSTYWTCPNPGTAGITSISVKGEDAFHNCVCEYVYSDGRRINGSAWKNTSQMAAVRAEAETLSAANNGPQLSGYHAIGDPGGVNGVAEVTTNEIPSARFLLEPFGVPVGNWSMVRGQNSSDTSYSFSDQFADLFSNQKVFRRVINGVPGANLNAKCTNMQALSIAAFGSGPSVAVVLPDPEDAEEDPIARLCTTIMGDPSTGSTDAIAAAVLSATQTEMRAMAVRIGYPRRCASCHNASQAPTRQVFTGARAEDFNAFGTYLTSATIQPSISNYESMKRVINPSHAATGTVPAVRTMPPSGFRAVTTAPAISSADVRKYFELFLTTEYVVASNTPASRAQLRALCNGIVQGSSAPSVLPGPVGEAPGAAPH